jgi:cytochrome c peroxidase
MNLNSFKTSQFILLSVILAVTGMVISACALQARDRWNEDELTTMRGLWIRTLKPLPADPSNKYAEDPRAAILGQALFFDTRFSANGQVACATCHEPELMFQDGTALAKGVGTTNRRTMTIVGTAYSPWLFWDGRKDSLWAQALGPLENPVEHGGNRTFYAHLIDQYYRSDYEAIFGPMPEVDQLPLDAGPVADPKAQEAWEAMSAEDRDAVTRIYTNIGKAIAAYERLILPGESRFDAYVEAVIDGNTEQAAEILTEDEVAGLRLFIGKANCTQCHNGPLFTNNDFHNTGIPGVSALPEDTGRALGAQQVVADEFNCLSAYSDAPETGCAELKYMTTDGHDLIRQYKPPSLRNVVGRGPYMHAGQFATLEDVLAHYNKAPAGPAGHSELEPLNLSQEEIRQLIAFLGTLSGPINADPRWLSPPNGMTTSP